MNVRFIHFTLIMNIHQQPWRSSSQYFFDCLLWFDYSHIMPLRNNRMTADLSWTFNYPVPGILFIKAAGVTNPSWLSIKALDFSPLIFSCCNTKNLVTTQP